MRPIEHRTDIEFFQALRCVQYRLPREGRLRRPGYLHALGLRYGLIGIAATFHLIEWANPEDERWVLNAARSWPCLVEDHMRNEMIYRLPFTSDDTVPVAVSQIAERSQRLAMPVVRRSGSLETCLNEVCRQFTEESLVAIHSNWPLYARKHARQEFFHITQESVGFAIHFYERRQYDLEELPEIAILGE